MTLTGLKPLSEKDLAQLKRLFQQVETDGAINSRDARICMEKWGVKLTEAQVNILIKKVDITDSDDIEFDEFVSICKLANQAKHSRSGDDYGDELSKPGTVNRSISGKNLSLQISAPKEDCFGKADSKYFRLIKQLWERASIPTELEQISSRYGAVNISNALKLKHPMAVKATAAVLLYLSVSPAWEDFLSDQFYNNIFIALEDEDNAPNYLWLVRLLRLLQVNKEFGDWILAKGDTPEDNHLWGRVYDISKSSPQEDVQKETSRAVKEGIREGVEAGRHCIIPPRIIERMKLDVIWKITEDDQTQLDTLARGNDPYGASSSTGSMRNRIQQLEAENRRTARVNKEKIEYLEKRIEMEKAEEARARADLQRGQARLKELKDRTVVKGGSTVGEKTLSDTTVSDPAAEKSLKDAVVGVQKETRSLVEHVAAMHAENKTMHRLITDFLAELHALRAGTQGKSEEIVRLKEGLSDYIHSEVENVQTNILPVVKPSGVSALPIVRVSLGPPTEVYPSALSPREAHTPPPPPTADLELPTGWERKMDPKTRRYYYYEVTTKIATWKFPQKSVLLKGEGERERERVQKGGQAAQDNVKRGRKDNYGLDDY